MAIARPNAVLGSRKVVLAEAEKVTATWTSTFTRDPFEVAPETKIAFLLELNETALAVSALSFVSSRLLCVDEQKDFGSSEGSRIAQRPVAGAVERRAIGASRRLSPLMVPALRLAAFTVHVDLGCDSNV